MSCAIGMYFLINFIGITNEVILLIFGQLLPAFLLLALPIALGDRLCVGFGLLEQAKFKEFADDQESQAH